MFAGFVDHSAEYDMALVFTVMADDGNVTSGTEHGSAEMRQMRMCGWRPGSNVPR